MGLGQGPRPQPLGLSGPGQTDPPSRGTGEESLGCEPLGRRIRPWTPRPRPIPRPSGSRSGPHSTAPAGSPPTLRTIFPTPCLVARSSYAARTWSKG